MSLDAIVSIISGAGGAALVAGVMRLLEQRSSRKDLATKLASEDKGRAAALSLEKRKLVLEGDREEFAEAEAVQDRIMREQTAILEQLKGQLAETLRRVRECDERSDAQDRKADDRAAEFERQIDSLRKKAKALADQHDDVVEENRKLRHEIANLRQAARLDREHMREQFNLPPSEPATVVPTTHTTLRMETTTEMGTEKPTTKS